MLKCIACVQSLILCVSVLPAAGHCGEEPSGSTGTIVVPECRILFTERRSLASELLGTVQTVADEGQRVQAGDIVVQLVDDVPRAALATAEARVASDVKVRSAAKAAEAAKAEYDVVVRANQSTQGGKPVYTESEIVRRRLAAEAAELEVETARQELTTLQRERDEAQAHLTQFSRSAPIDGLVTRVYKHSGETLQQSEPVLEIVNPDRVRIEGFVPAAEASRLHVGQPVVARAVSSGALPAVAEDEFAGTLGFVDVTVQPISRMVRVWAEVANRDQLLRDGLTATLIIDVTADRKTDEAPARESATTSGESERGRSATAD